MALEFAQPLGVDDVGEIEVWLIFAPHCFISTQRSPTLHCHYNMIFTLYLALNVQYMILDVEMDVC